MPESPAGELAAALPACTQPVPGLPWYDISDPDSPALDELARRFQLHELQVEDCRHRPQRAKVEEHEHYLFCVLKKLHNEEALRFDDVNVFLGRDFIVTVHAGNTAVVEKVRRRAEQGALRGRVDALLYFVLDVIVDEYLPVLDRVSDEISDIENAVLHSPEPHVLRRIFRLKRRLVEFRRVSSTMREVVNGVMRHQGGLYANDLWPYLRDVYDHLVRTAEITDTSRDLLGGALDIYLSAVANRTNAVMKVLAIYGIVTLPFVVVTGFFGMNLDLPFADQRWGAVYAVGIMLAFALGILLYFRSRKLL